MQIRNLINKLRSFLLTNTSSKQTVIKNTFWLLLAEGISKGSLAILVIMIGRIFGKEVFGQYSYLSVLLTFLIVFADLGITQLTIRDYQHLDVKHRRQYLISGLWTKLRLSIGVAVVYFVVLRQTSPNPSLTGGESIWWRTIGLILLSNNLTNSFLEYMRSTFRSLQRGETELRVKFVQGIGNLLLIPLLFVYESLPLNLLGQSIVTLITIGYTWYLVRDRQLTEHTDEIITTKKQLIQNGWMFAMSGLFVSLYYYIDSVIIQYYWGYEAVGVYSAAYRMLTIFIIPVGIIVNTLFPTFRNLFKENINEFHKIALFYIKLVFFASIILFSILFIISDKIFVFSFGTEYADSSKIFSLLLVSLFILYNNAVAGIALQSANRQNIYMISTIIALLVNIILNMSLIPRFGIVGAAYSTIITEITVSLIQSFYYYFILRNES